ncbi:hypothetical protein K469DRAFT_668537 [Zopfia rhizophila CBS 207.26]|uniref:Zn(2)-C6 fungal-type domain-containing protein n=1 Tax=Zopfia rhizophila CBS 207.26 TaxID=1314779 RepID=A0A6A6DW74_9PEZI|nr:hypothetical protein K469DRAFT_668537 [Zopfia rhizophila CBS 207.26]
MVGVPGRSKGCSTCRARKKKAILQCDLQQPTCGNCLKGKFVCGGYRRDMIVVQVDPKSRTGKYKPMKAETCRGDIVRAISPADARFRDLNRTALEVKCFDTFWALYLPKTLRNNSISDDLTAFVVNWAELAQALTSGNDILRCALLALSVSKVGQLNNDRAMIQRGMELYGKTLSRVGSALRNLATLNKMEVLTTCTLLALYEVGSLYFCILNNSDQTTGSSRNWQGHVDGTSRLLQLRPPEAYSSDAGHKIFVNIRYSGAIAALSARKANFLSTPEWATSPWKGRYRGPFDSLNDILVKLPILYEEFDNLISVNTKSEEKQRARSLVKTCWTLDRQLQTWYQNYVYSLSKELTPEELEFMLRGVGQGPQEELPNVLLPLGLGFLHNVVLYWSICIILYSSMAIIFKKFPEESSASMKPLHPARMNGHKYALCVSRCIKHFLHPDAGLAGAMFAIFPIRCVSKKQYYVYHDSMEADKELSADFMEIQDTLEEVRQTPGGSWIASFLIDLNRDIIAKKHEVVAGKRDPSRSRAKEWLANGKYDKIRTPLLLFAPPGRRR